MKPIRRFEQEIDNADNTLIQEFNTPYGDLVDVIELRKRLIDIHGNSTDVEDALFELIGELS